MSLATETMIQGYAQVAVTVKNLEQAVSFYRDVLGLPLLFQAPPGLAFFQCGDVRLMLAQPEGNGAVESHPTLYYRVPDIHSAVAALRARDAVITDEPHVVARLQSTDVWLSFTSDPDGHLVGLMSEVERTS